MSINTDVESVNPDVILPQANLVNQILGKTALLPTLGAAILGGFGLYALWKKPPTRPDIIGILNQLSGWYDLITTLPIIGPLVKDALDKMFADIGGERAINTLVDAIQGSNLLFRLIEKTPVKTDMLGRSLRG